MTPAEYIKSIDSRYKDAVEKNLSRFSIEWGEWSRQMNLEIRKAIEDQAPEAPLLKNVFIYWTVMSQLLELNYTGWSLIKYGKKKKLQKERDHIKKAVLSGKPKKFSEQEMIRRAVKR